MVLGATPRRRTTIVLVVLDTVMVSLALALAAYIRFFLDLPIFESASPSLDQIWLFAAGLIPVWLLLLAAEGAYNKKNLFVGGEEYRRVFHANNLAGLVGVLVIFALKAPISRAWVLISWSLALIFLQASRYLYRNYVHRQNRRNAASTTVMIVGANAEAADVAEQINSSTHLGANVVGALDGTGEVDGRLESIGHVSDLVEHVNRVNPDALVVVPSALGADARPIYQSLKKVSASVYIAPSLRDVMESRVSIQPIGGMPLIRVEPAKIEGFAWVGKRAFDLTMSALLLITLSPLLLLVSIAIVIESRGPVFFVQERVGRDLKRFGILKFRSMVRDAEEKLEDIAHLNEADGHVFKIKDDPRVTKVGGFIRRWSIDELPQLFNVLTGKMSLVGPRPPLPDEVEKYDEWQKGRLSTLPGMTGYWQVSGRSDTSFKEMVKLDIFYIENWSLSFDLYILAMTLKAVASRAGAY